jgi:hypothetical protein
MTNPSRQQRSAVSMDASRLRKRAEAVVDVNLNERTAH